MATGAWQDLTYPISLDYRAHWGNWQAIREIIQNCLDESGTYTVEKLPTGIAICDKGKGFSIRHLIFGVSEKESEDSRGKFGEGLKIALIVLKRTGCDIRVQSGDLELVVETAEIEGVKVLKLKYRLTTPIVGTRIEVTGYKGELYDDYFAINECVQQHVIHTCSSGQIIDDGKARLYVKDIYVQQLSRAQFSYNLKNVMLEESRSIASEESVQRAITDVWSYVDNVSMLRRFVQAIKDDKYEAKSSGAYPKHSTAVCAAFRAVHGNKAVLQTQSEYAREARWRGMSPVEMPWEIRDFFIHAGIQTDKAYITQDNKRKTKKVSKTKLPQIEKLTLRAMNTFVQMIDHDAFGGRIPSIKVVPFDYPNGDNTLGQWDEAHKVVKINRTVLSRPIKSLDIVLHEITHAYYNAKDLTAEMIIELGRVSALGVTMATCSESNYARAFRYFFRKASKASANLKVEGQ